MKSFKFKINDNAYNVDINEVEGGETLANGKYIENGQIVIVKDGVKYNVAGQVIK